MAPYALPVGIVGVLASIVAFAYTRHDAGRVGVSHSLLWALATSGTLATGVCMYLFTSAPLPGVIMTANTGTVLYGFERELTRRDDQPAHPGQLPFGSTESDSVDEESGAGGESPADPPTKTTEADDVAEPR